MHEAVWAYGRKNLFCRASSFTKQIFIREFGVFCLILPHVPHIFIVVRQLEPKNMRFMREYEDRVFKGFYLFRIVNRARPSQKYEAGFRFYEDHPHIFAIGGMP